jgi:hypothetical protein
MLNTPANAENYELPYITGEYFASILTGYVLSTLTVNFEVSSFPTMLPYLSAKAMKVGSKYPPLL